MSVMRGTQRDHESNLDALLEDLQTTVSRSNSSVGLNGQTSGYRSIRRMVTDGTPEGTSSEYQVEYLNPANSTQQVVESSFNGSSSEHRNDHHRYKGILSGGSSGDVKLKHNISELDSLLDDLNAAQRKNFSSSTISTSHSNTGIDSGLLEPATSTPARMIEKHYREEKTSLRGRSPSPRGRELVFTGPRSRDPSPVPLDYHTSFEQREQTPTVQQFYRYEKTTSTRTTAPTVTTEYPNGYDPNGTIRSYNYSEDTTTPLAIRDRSPSPLNSSVRQHVNSYNYASSKDSTSSGVHDRVPASYSRETEQDGTPKYGSTKTAYSYSSSTTRESRSDGQHPPPPPHRSPSPVSFQQPPLPGSKNSKSYSESSPPPVRRSQSPQRFSPSDPSHKISYSVSPPHSATAYKYSSTTKTSSNAYHDDLQHNMKPRPFPTSPGEQQPPKKLDELLATLSDGSSPTTPEPPQRDRYSETNVHRYTTHHTSSHRHATSNGLNHSIGNGHPPATPGTPEPTKILKYSPDSKGKEFEKEKLLEREDSKGTSGPPVYYPPGVELFTKKEEAMMQKQESGSKYKAMAKYEYEAKSKSKQSESTKKAVVPVCLPVCCAMPCTIM